MASEENGGTVGSGAAVTKVEPVTGIHGSSSPSGAGARTVAELATDELDRLVPVLDANVREAVRTLPTDPALDDLKSFAAACRIERRRRHGRDRITDAHLLFGGVG